MGIDMRGFKVVYKERVYNAVNMNWNWKDCPPDIEAREKGVAMPDFLDVLIIDEDGAVKLIHDEAFMFQFLRITEKGC